ncbi:MAG TPA: AAA family ATPase, partial [Armatimonadota bacterium]|nr:AAA family ATPase [Armatimonadota bacterium]
CYGQPRAFASDHSRFRYFRKGDRCLDYAIFDDTRSEVTFLCGLPGAGKDTWIRANRPGLPVISLDALREELGIDVRGNQHIVARAARERAKRYLRAHEPFVWNATNLTRQIRAPLIEQFYDYGARTQVVYLHTSLPRTVTQNRLREAVVPEPVIHRMMEKLEVPDLTEAHGLTIVEGSATTWSEPHAA